MNIDSEHLIPNGFVCVADFSEVSVRRVENDTVNFFGTQILYNLFCGVLDGFLGRKVTGDILK